jgi:hypothetical protein
MTMSSLPFLLASTATSSNSNNQPLPMSMLFSQPPNGGSADGPLNLMPTFLSGMSTTNQPTRREPSPASKRLKHE